MRHTLRKESSREVYPPHETTRNFPKPTNHPSYPVSHTFEQFLKRKPVIGKNVFLAKGSVVCGAVTLKDHASVWFNAVLRADMNEMTIGCHTNIQDNAVFHVSLDAPLELGDYVTIGHGAILHGCKVGDNCLIGMGSILLDHVEVPPGCMVGAGSLLTPKLKAPPNSLIVGSPAKVVRELKPKEIEQLKLWALEYSALAQYHLSNPPPANS